MADDDPPALDAQDEQTIALIERRGWQAHDLLPATADPTWRPDKTNIDASDQKLLGDVRDFGWHHLHIHPDAGLRWSFSVGLFETWGHPEVVVFGLDMETAQGVLSVAADIAKAGQQAADGTHAGDFIEAYEVCFLRVRPHWYGSFLGYAQWYNGTAGGFPVLQLVWPDASGRFPWEAGCTLSPGTQLLLGAPPDTGVD